MTGQQIMDHMSQLIRVGFVTARQPEKHRVQVELRDTVTSRLTTKWLPVLCPRASGDLHYDLPDIGDQVLCLFLPYGLEQGFVVGAMYGRQTPPVSDPEKFHRRFKDGATIEYDRANHALSATIPGTATIKCAGPMTLEAPTVYVRGTLVNTAKDGSPGKAVFSGGMEVLDGGISVPDSDVKAGNVSLVSHTTTGVQPGDGISDIPVGGVPGGVAATVIAGMAGGSGGSGSGGAGSAGGGSSNAARHVASLRTAVDAGGSDTEKLLLCLPDIAAAMAEEQSNANDRQGWLYLHDMFEQWLGGPGNEDALNNPRVFWVDMDWALSYIRAHRAFSELCVKSYLFSPNARLQLVRILQRDGKLLPEGRVDFDYTDRDWTHWQADYFQQTTVEGMDALSADGLMAAMGNFQLRALAKGYTEAHAGGHLIVIKGVSIIVWDSFNFAGDADLGFWKCTPAQFSDSRFDGAVELHNKDFQEFRSNYGRGNDFLVLSQPEPVDPPMVFSYETDL